MNVENTLAKYLTERKLTICTAESCTGGLIASTITDLAGSSNYFLGGVVSYSNLVKENVLGVQGSTIEAYGAVSEQTVQEMAIGAKKLIQADVSISISGIMGPSGGSLEKPVGTTWICVLVQDKLFTKLFHFSGDRLENKKAAKDAALIFTMQCLTQES